MGASSSLDIRVRARAHGALLPTGTLHLHYHPDSVFAGSAS